MEDATASETGGVRSAIANVVVGTYKEYYGRGPTGAKAYFNDDWIFVVLEGGLTRSEETLVAAGEQGLVRDVRLKFQEVVTERLCAAVSELVGRPVQTYHSQLLFDPVRTVEMFLLGD